MVGIPLVEAQALGLVLKKKNNKKKPQSNKYPLSPRAHGDISIAQGSFRENATWAPFIGENGLESTQSRGHRLDIWAPLVLSLPSFNNEAGQSFIYSIIGDSS